MRRYWNALLGILLLLLCPALLSGCQSGIGEEQQPQQQQSFDETGTDTAGTNTYHVYYTNLDSTDLISVDYQTEETDLTALANELVAEMFSDGSSAVGAEEYQSAFAEEDVVEQVTIDTSVARVKFSAYVMQDAAEEVLCRAALTRTLTDLEGIDYVYMMLGESPLMDENQQSIGFLAASDFVSIVGKNVNSYNRLSFVLYYANEDGTKLMGETVDITYSGNFSVEGYVLDRLIAGPDSEGLYPTLPDSMRVLSISVKDGTCYVNLDDSFISQALDIDANLAVYSIVNSLTELSNINNVRIMVNGSSDIVYMDVVSLNTALERNLDYYGGLVE